MGTVAVEPGTVVVPPPGPCPPPPGTLGEGEITGTLELGTGAEDEGWTGTELEPEPAPDPAQESAFSCTLTQPVTSPLLGEV
jgi:hypothetical protein